MLERIVLAAALALGIGCSPSNEADSVLPDALLDYYTSASDARSAKKEIDSFQSSSKTKNPAATCPNGTVPKTYLRDRDQDGYYDKGVVACTPPSDGFKYVAKEAVVPPREIPLFDCNDNPHNFGPVTYPGAPELCNDNDDNCNGLVDDNVAPETEPCTTACGQGYKFRDCLPEGQWSAVWSPCSAGIPGGEICNGADDDCSGTIDDNLFDTPASCTTYCGTGTPLCKDGVWTCDPNPTAACCEIVGEQEELVVCNSIAQVFAIDFSASMNDSIAVTQKKLSDYVTELQQKSSGPMLGIIPFTDKVLSPHGWVTSYDEFKTWLLGYQNESSPEGHLYALNAALDLKWPEKAERYLILIGNSEFLDNEGADDFLLQIQTKAADKGIQIIALEVLVLGYQHSPDYNQLAGLNTYVINSTGDLKNVLEAVLHQGEKYKGKVCNSDHTWVGFDECSDN